MDFFLPWAKAVFLSLIKVWLFIHLHASVNLITLDSAQRDCSVEWRNMSHFRLGMVNHAKLQHWHIPRRFPIQLLANISLIIWFVTTFFSNDYFQILSFAQLYFHLKILQSLYFFLKAKRFFSIPWNFRVLLKLACCLSCFFFVFCKMTELVLENFTTFLFCNLLNLSTILFDKSWFKSWLLKTIYTTFFLFNSNFQHIFMLYRRLSN